MGKLAGKMAVLTGGTSGIGLATAQRFVAEGAYVFITGRRQAELDAAVQQIGNNVTGVQGDVANLADLDRLYATVQQQQGRIDVLFANAGLGEFVPLGQIPEAHFDKTFGINVKGTLFTVQKALPLLPDGASVVINGSMTSIKGTPAFGVYAATKVALRSFARTWSVDLKDRQLRVNVVSPGMVITPGYTNELGLSDEQIEQIKAQAAAATPLGRAGTPDEIAKAVVFLASADSSYVTGSELFVDGGMAQISPLRAGDAVLSSTRQRSRTGWRLRRAWKRASSQPSHRRGENDAVPARLALVIASFSRGQPLATWPRSLITKSGQEPTFIATSSQTALWTQTHCKQDQEGVTANMATTSLTLVGN
jgi:NAD(P)-dependent dehydrogenase (short-subunit alcohol dehydrogenase family)